MIGVNQKGLYPLGYVLSMAGLTHQSILAGSEYIFENPRKLDNNFKQMLKLRVHAGVSLHTIRFDCCLHIILNRP